MHPMARVPDSATTCTASVQSSLINNIHEDIMNNILVNPQDHSLEMFRDASDVFLGCEVAKSRAAHMEMPGGI